MAYKPYKNPNVIYYAEELHKKRCKKRHGTDKHTECAFDVRIAFPFDDMWEKDKIMRHWYDVAAKYMRAKHRREMKKRREERDKARGVVRKSPAIIRTEKLMAVAMKAKMVRDALDDFIKALNDDTVTKEQTAGLYQVMIDLASVNKRHKTAICTTKKTK